MRKCVIPFIEGNDIVVLQAEDRDNAKLYDL
jgi:hypothetical protein